MAHNGFSFDFVFLVAEVQRRKLDEIFGSIDIYFADTLYDVRRVSGAEHPLLLLSFCSFSIQTYSDNLQ